MGLGGLHIRSLQYARELAAAFGANADDLGQGSVGRREARTADAALKFGIVSDGRCPRGA